MVSIGGKGGWGGGGTVTELNKLVRLHTVSPGKELYQSVQYSRQLKVKHYVVVTCEIISKIFQPLSTFVGNNFP